MAITSTGEVHTTDAARSFLPSSNPVSPKKSPAPSLAMTRFLPPLDVTTSHLRCVRSGKKLNFACAWIFRARARARALSDNIKLFDWVAGLENELAIVKAPNERGLVQIFVFRSESSKIMCVHYFGIACIVVL